MNDTTRQPEIALVTGAGRGIGAACALGLAEDGFDIWLNYRSDHEHAAGVRARIEALGRSCVLMPFDVTDAGAVRDALAGRLEQDVPAVLVNNAGITRDSIFGLMSEEDWTAVLDVHLNGFFHVTRQLVPLMQRRRTGRIINIVSTSGQAGVPGQVNYSAAKAGLIGATKALARELGRRNILVNAVAPGFIKTDMTGQLDGSAYLPSIPLNRVGTPEDVAGCVRFLCSPLAGYITGQIIGVNGGLYM